MAFAVRRFMMSPSRVLKRSVDRDVPVSPNLAYAACASNVPEAIVTAESSVVSTPHRNVPDISTVPDVIELDTWI
jgi:hypothetical protein